MFVEAESLISVEVTCGIRAAVENRDVLIGRQQPKSMPQNTESTVSMRTCTAQGNNGAFFRLEKRQLNEAIRATSRTERGKQRISEINPHLPHCLSSCPVPPNKVCQSLMVQELCR